MVIAQTAAPRFEIGRVVKRTFSVIGKNVGAFVLLSILSALTWTASVVAGSQFGAAIEAGRFPETNTILVLAIWLLLYLASGMLLQGGVIYGAVASLNGKRASFAECFATGLKYLWPLFLLGLLAMLGILAALVLLVVPGIILAVMWIAASPACVVEHTGVSAAFSRSVQLTRGYRWPIFGLYVAYTILTFVIAFVVGLLIGSMIGFGMVVFSPNASATLTNADTSAADLIVEGISMMLSMIIGSAFSASTYYELRQVKEGIEPEALASVFD